MVDAAGAERFRQLFEREQARVYRFVYAMVGAAETAKELTQETFFRAFRSIDAFESRSAASTWLCGIARNVTLNHLRAQRPQADEMPEGIDDDGPDRQLLSRELREAIRVALLRLDDDKRAAFTLKVLEGRSYDEIAEITGSAVAKLRTDVHRARLQLREALRGFREER
ncbi:MAG TPA: RNA polymerase sigma factor [Thermoanaerobaculia bacterium]|jgi:RNA polymerase sigma-70 factor (ECF subfamily)